MIKTRDIILATLILIGFWVAGEVIKVDAFTTPLPVVYNYSMQPFGKGAEDDVTATDIIQPTYLGVQVTLNGQFLQGSK
jgi:hypothetical protein